MWVNGGSKLTLKWDWKLREGSSPGQGMRSAGSAAQCAGERAIPSSAPQKGCGVRCWHLPGSCVLGMPPARGHNPALGSPGWS